MELAKPYMLWLLLLLVPPLVWYILKERRLHAALQVSTVKPFGRLRTPWRAAMRHVVFGMSLLSLGCLIVILARPQSHDAWRTSNTEGTDIVLAVDISTSMLARDFNPDRIESAKEMATRFVAGRQGDNMGLVIFAGESFTAVPMTTDRAQLVDFLQHLRIGMIKDGTAIGDGVATAINRVRSGRAKSKSIVLLTDGTNNTGNVSPTTAAEIAAKNGIKLYTIGVGSKGTAEMPVGMDARGRYIYERMPVDFDEPTLQKMASMTGGKYFRATNAQALGDIFDMIDSMEKTRMDIRNFSSTEDDYQGWAIAAIALFGCALLLRYTVLRSIP